MSESHRRHVPLDGVQGRQARPLIGTTLLAAVILTAVLFLDVQGKRMDLRRAATDVTVEHEGILTLHMTKSTGKARGIIEFRPEGNAVALTIPSAWDLREVRGGTLDAVKGDVADEHSTRWNIPAGVTLSLWTNDSPSLLIRNASADPLLVLAKRVHVVTGGKEEKSVLVKEGSVKLW